MALTDKLVNIADAIRGKTGKTDAMTLDQMVTEIEGISGGGGAISGDGWVSGVPYEFNVISDVYIAKDGNEIAYGGWSSTDYIPCHGVTALLHTYVPGAGTYYAFYGADYEVLPTSEKPLFSGSTLGVPANAYYYRASDGSNLQDLAIVPIAI